MKKINFESFNCASAEERSFNCDCGELIDWAKAGPNRKIRSKRKQYLFPENYDLMICNKCNEDWLTDSQIDELQQMIENKELIEYEV